jgi:hypothetical protein
MSDKTDREKTFGPITGTHLWCLHCERTYLKTENRVDGRGLQLCPYSDCDGDAVIDAWEWDRVRQGREDRYPLVPVHRSIYPLYDDIVGKWLKSRRNPTRCDAAGCDNHVGSGVGWVFRFDDGDEFCRRCAEGMCATLTVGNGKPQRFVIGSPPQP